MSSVRHPIFARVYEVLARSSEDSPHRAELLEGLSGHVVEVGAGTGLTFPHYPASVTRVTAVEPEPYLRTRAQEAAREAPVRIEVVDGVDTRIPLADDEADAAVASLVLCSVADQGRALAELRRVLRPGGELRFYEHVLARDPRLARTQRFLARGWPRFSGGCHPDRDTVAAIEAAGFELVRARHFPFVASPIVAPLAPHVVGVARNPA